MILEMILSGIAVMSVTFIGAIFLYEKAGNFVQRRLSYLVAISAGVFLVVAISLAREVYELSTSVAMSTLLIVLGYFFAILVQKFLPESHHHHDKDCHDSHQTAVKVLIGAGIHNTTDGLVIATAYFTNPALGLATTLSIVIHEALQQFSKFFILRKAGLGVAKALLVNFAVSASIILGIAIGYLGVSTPGLEVWLLALGAGFFFHIFINDLYPKRAVYANKSEFYRHLLLVALGVFLMAIVTALAGEFSHGH